MIKSTVALVASYVYMQIYYSGKQKEWQGSSIAACAFIWGATQFSIQLFVCLQRTNLRQKEWHRKAIDVLDTPPHGKVDTDAGHKGGGVQHGILEA